MGKVKQHRVYYRQATAVGKHVFLWSGVPLLPLLLKDVLSAQVLLVLVLTGMLLAAISTIVYKRLIKKREQMQQQQSNSCPVCNRFGIEMCRKDIPAFPDHDCNPS